MAAILGISAFYHDSASALVVGGWIVAAAGQRKVSGTNGTSLSRKRLQPRNLRDRG